MNTLYESNWLVARNQRDIEKRESFERLISSEIENYINSQNPAFAMHKCEVSQITPLDKINENYTPDDYYLVEEWLVLRPETTMGSFAYANHLLNPHNKPKIKLPLCVYQHWKSFRKEQDKTLSNMRLKEFYQLEYQIIYNKESWNDYYDWVVQFVYKLLSKILWECQLVPSDRLPDYSLQTMDVEYNGMEICSISKRKDFRAVINNQYTDCYVAEIAIGTDRMVYQFNNK